MILMAEAVKQAIWGVLFSWPRPVYYFSVLPARERQLSFSAAARKLALSGRSTEKIFTGELIRREMHISSNKLYIFKSPNIQFT